MIRAAFVLAVLAGPAWAGEALRLAAGMSPYPGVQGTPRVLAGVPDMVRGRVNAALAQADARGRDAGTQCRTEREGIMASAPGGRRDWTRSVQVTQAGPRWLSVLIADEYYCGGPYPSAEAYPLVFDLRTGRPAEVRAVLPPGVDGEARAGTAADGARLGVIRSLALTRQVRAGASAECAAALENNQDFVLWPEHGTWRAVAFGLPHVMAACAVPIPLHPAR